jgi:hypothetical protein
VRGSLRQCGSVRQCEQQCVAVRTVVCSSAHGSVRAVRAIVYGSARGSFRLCGSAAVCGCAAVR